MGLALALVRLNLLSMLSPLDLGLDLVWSSYVYKTAEFGDIFVEGGASSVQKLVSPLSVITS